MFHFFFINIGAIWNIRSENAGDASSLETQRDSCRGKRKQKPAEQKIGKKTYVYHVTMRALALVEYLKDIYSNLTSKY